MKLKYISGHLNLDECIIPDNTAIRYINEILAGKISFRLTKTENKKLIFNTAK